ncbi:ABC transporter ATP-binding protein [Sciscionella sediminilitoris]|uniref:ABC transporter ATP-binding protein n=1 Tax=Sciscionella sediminilitoris TaxID=1445613 RepID=UPI0004DF0A78|nr:ABC transporter ATP-binding protein [Sciscionella sp. SE31]
MTEPMTGIATTRVTKSYPGSERPAVHDVSLHIADGEFMTFLGPSGSGKTTMLSMIAGFTPLSAGSITVDGREISRLRPHRRELGVVFQQYALFPHLSVERNVAFGLAQRKRPKAEIDRRVGEVLEMVGLSGMRERFPRQLSGGQQQRVALARAVAYEPRALLLDEPLAALDKRLRDQLQREIAHMHRELGMTFLFVTHDQQEALTLSDRIAVFNEGRIEQLGTPAELYERPRTLFVAQFLGESNALRLRPGEVTIVRPERVTLHTGDESVAAGQQRRTATVTDVVYVGDHSRIWLRYADGARGCAVLGAGTAHEYRPGSEVVVAWRPEHEAVVPDTERSPA